MSSAWARAAASSQHLVEQSRIVGRRQRRSVREQEPHFLALPVHADIGEFRVGDVVAEMLREFPGDGIVSSSRRADAQ
jgi:hypothetical protein